MWRQLSVSIFLASAFLSSPLAADGNVSFGGGVPAVVDESSPAFGKAKGKPAAPAKAPARHVESFPGIHRAIFSPVTSEESEQAIQSRPVPADLNQPDGTSGDFSTALRIAGDTAPAGPASIAELARALRNDPDLIYEYVRNNIEY